VRFRLLTEADVKAVLTMDDLIETMASALQRFSSAQVVQPLRLTIRWRPTRFDHVPPTFAAATTVRPRTRAPSRRLAPR
jgi:ornithine cyclodeaminase/alanine dehydrogenase-like protein (mu-crystallin family)